MQTVEFFFLTIPVSNLQLRGRVPSNEAPQELSPVYNKSRETRSYL